MPEARDRVRDVLEEVANHAEDYYRAKRRDHVDYDAYADRIMTILEENHAD